MSVRIGLLLPTREATMAGDHDPAPLLALARDAEDAGFDSVWAGDSLTARPRLEPLALMAAVAAITNRVELGTAALIAPMRHPLTTAHGIATVDRISAGRLVLGLGSGAPTPGVRAEFDAVGVPFRERTARLDEMVADWTAAWRTGGSTAGSGEIARLIPPVRPGGPPLWLAGGDTDRVIERIVARYDGWLPYLPDVRRYASAWQRIRLAAEQAGRDPESITPALYATAHVDEDTDRAHLEFDRYVQGYYGMPFAEMSSLQAYYWGPPGGAVDWLARYVEAGARHLVLRIGARTIEHQWPRLRDEVLPALRARFD